MAYNFGGLFPAARRQIEWPRRFPGSALVLASLLLPLGLFVVDATRSYNRAIEDGERNINSTAAIFEEHAHNTFETYQLVLSLLDENIRGRSWEELEHSRSLRGYLAQLVHDHPQIGGLALLDAKGFIRVGTMKLPNPAPNFADRGYFIALRDHDRGTYIAERVHSRLERSDELNIVQRRTTADGTFDGVLAVGVRPATAFLDFWGKGPEGTNTALIRADGGVLARFPKPDVDLTTIRLNTPFVLEAITGDQIYRPATSQIDHVSRMVSFQQVSGFPVVLVHGMALNLILRPWRDGLWRNAALYGGATAGLVMLALFANSHSRRETIMLQQLTRQTDSLSDEVANRKRAEADLQNVLFDIVKRQEADRLRIARDLHDSLGQHVALLLLNADSIGRTPENTHAVSQRVAQQKEIATEISQELSRIAWELRPVWLDDMGLEAAIGTLTNIMRERSGIEFRLDCSLGDRRFSPTVEATVYRALQEAMTNIIKHAEATYVDILLDVCDGSLRLLVEDNGKGFPQATSEAPGFGGSPYGGLGLRGIRERMAMVEGSLRIESEPGNGTAFILDVPA